MIAWATIDTALVVAVKAVTGLDDVFWAWEPSAMRSPQYVRLERSPLSVLGVDARESKRVTIDPVPDPPAFPDEIVTRQHGQRTFSLELRCVSNVGSPSDTAPLDPNDILGTAQTRIRRPTVRSALRTAGVALSSVGPVTRQVYSVDGREMRASILSLVFLTADCDVDDASDGAIESASGTTTIESPDGSMATRTWSSA